MTLEQMTVMAARFRDERDWRQFHTPKELAISLVVESAELLELMQWKQGEELKSQIEKKRGEIADELADCLHSIVLLGEELGIDLGEAFVAKLKKAEKKYPVSKCRGRAEKYTDL